jgi:hypothetical protein
MHSEKSSLGLKIAAWGGLVFLHFPILIIFLYAFNTEEAAFSFPPQGFTRKWFSVAFARPDVLEAIKLSLQIAAIATLIAMVLGTLASAALYRREFFGKQGVSLMLILPIALPGIITGIALLATFKTLGIEPGMFTIIVGHATFCVVIVYNNVIARLRRTSHSLIEASMDLPLHHHAQPRLGAAGRRHAGVCAVVRRNHRHHLHRRPRAYVAAVVAQPIEPATGCAGDQCGRDAGDAGDDVPDPGRLLPDPRW